MNIVWQVTERFRLESKMVRYYIGQRGFKSKGVQKAVINAVKVKLEDPLTLVGWGATEVSFQDHTNFVT